MLFLSIYAKKDWSTANKGLLGHKHIEKDKDEEELRNTGKWTQIMWNIATNLVKPDFTSFKDDCVGLCFLQNKSHIFKKNTCGHRVIDY